MDEPDSDSDASTEPNPDQLTIGELAEKKAKEATQSLRSSTAKAKAKSAKAKPKSQPKAKASKAKAKPKSTAPGRGGKRPAASHTPGDTLSITEAMARAKVSKQD